MERSKVQDEKVLGDGKEEKLLLQTAEIDPEEPNELKEEQKNNDMVTVEDK